MRAAKRRSSGRNGDRGTRGSPTDTSDDHPAASKQTAYGIGLMMHLMMGAAFGLVHAGILTAFDPTTNGAATLLGFVLGVVHGLIITMILPMMLTMAHPLVRRGDIAQPGLALTGFGATTPVGATVAHGVFGLVPGAIYVGVVG